MFTWLSGVAGTLSGWMMSPWLFLGGALAVLSPIIIHLLNKRKFRTIDWAAMDFLLEADKRNRRRIRLENLLLLLLRCLAVLLIALLVARPFWPSGMGGRLFDTVRYERIVVLDDSLSMNVQHGGVTTFDIAKRGLSQFVTELAANDSDDSLTLYVASEPQRPVFNSRHIDEDTVADVADEIKELTASDSPARLEAAVVEVERSLATRGGEVNRVVYLLTDLQQRDWSGGKDGAAGASTARTSAVENLTRLSEKVAGCFLVDVGGEEAANLTLTEIVPQEKTLVEGVASRFQVSVKNNGPADVSGVSVKLFAGESLPIEREIDVLPAGQTASIPFTFTFARAEDTSSDRPPEPVKLQAELTARSPATEDRLADDNTRYFAARVTRGIPTLLVDGDPSATYGKSETFYLKRALAPKGDVLSGVVPEVITEVEFETVPLDDYEIIYICNLYRLSEPRREALDRWVQAGGALIFMLGDQVDKQSYNEDLYKEGKGLFPLRLEGIVGDDSGEKWFFFDVQVKNHPVLKHFEGENNDFREGAKIFQFYGGAVAEEDVNAGRVSVLARFTDQDAAPAIVEMPHGDGRVLVVTTSADVEWNNWPQDLFYPVAMQEFLRYMARSTAARGVLAVGEPIRQPIDLADFKMTDIKLIHRPDLKSNSASEPTTLQATPASEAAGAADETSWKAEYEDTNRRGFYTIELERADGSPQQVLFAANIDPAEGDLRRADRRTLETELGDSVRVVDNTALAALGTDNIKGELWRYVLYALIGILCLEQLLGWRFGRKR